MLYKKILITLALSIGFLPAHGMQENPTGNSWLYNKLWGARNAVSYYIPESVQNAVERWNINTQKVVLTAIVASLLAVAAYNKDSIIKYISSIADQYKNENVENITPGLSAENIVSDDFSPQDLAGRGFFDQLSGAVQEAASNISQLAKNTIGGMSTSAKDAVIGKFVKGLFDAGLTSEEVLKTQAPNIIISLPDSPVERTINEIFDNGSAAEITMATIYLGAISLAGVTALHYFSQFLDPWVLQGAKRPRFWWNEKTQYFG